MTLPVDVGIGMLTGALVALVLKTRDRTPTASELAMTLEQTGVRVARVERAAVDARGSVPWFVSTTDGDELFVKTLNSDQRAADLLFRIYRMIRLRRPGDRKPFSSLRRAVEHEAFLSLAAESRDIRTPRLVAATEIGNDGMLLAYRKLEGRSLDSVDPGEITDAMLVGVWRLVALLRSAAIAHRDLRLANVFIADDGVPWLIDFGFAELAADETLLARDTAELLASTATVVGPEQSVAVAIEVLGKDTVAAATPWIQPLALSSATRSQVGDRDQFSRLHAAAASALGLEEVEHEKMERVSRTTMLLVASVGFSLYVLIPQLATETGYFDELAGIHFGWAGLALAASALTYVGATWTVMGSVPVRLEVGPVLSTQLATSFSRRVTLTSLEASSTNVRLLQKHNLPRSVTETAVRLTAVAETAVFDSLLAASLLGAGWLAEAALTTAVIVGTIVVGSAALTVLPTGRALLVRRLKRFRLASAATTALTKSPSRLLALYGGTAVVIISYTACMLASLRAFGVDLPVATGAAVYLMASATAALIPTPGSIGVSEAALFLGYRIVGVAVPAAFAAVLLFRFVTFWLPLVPGWLALRALRRSGRL
jgi:undecaprenyl-diphosphatase